jgi:hypothetical protein
MGKRDKGAKKMSNPTFPSVVAIIVKTYRREGAIQSLVKTIEEYSDLPYRLYIADEHPISIEKENFYKKLIAIGHEILLFHEAKPVSVCYARNKLIQLLKNEKYVLRLDDDFHFSQGTHLSKLKKILDSRPEIGAVSGIEIQGVDGKGIRAGELSSQQGMLLYNEETKTLFKQPVPVGFWHWRSDEGIKYAYADFTRNFLLIKRDVFNKISWNESLQIQGEHTDFMLQLKKSGWLLAFTPESIHTHNEPRKTSVENKYIATRQSQLGRDKMKNVFRQEWGIEYMSTLNDFRVSESNIFELFLHRVVINPLRVLKRFVSR